MTTKLPVTATITINPSTWPTLPPAAFVVPTKPEDGTTFGIAAQRAGLGAYAIAYAHAAHALFYSATRGGVPDLVVFPITMLWRHSFELQLKEIIRLGELIAQVNATTNHHHKLRPLWDAAAPYVTKLNPPRVADAERLIDELHTLDPTGESFRFQKDRAGAPTLPNIPPVIDLRHLHGAMSGLYNFFDFVIAELRAQWSAIP